MVLLGQIEHSEQNNNFKVEKPSPDEVRASWIRLLSLPREVNPAIDMTGKNCQVGQSPGMHWFLQSTLGGTANRACTIPPRRAIICNVLSCELSDPELQSEEYTDSELEERTRAPFEKVDLNSLRFEVDGKSAIKIVDDWKNYYGVQTPQSEVVLPQNNMFRVRPGLTRFAAYGYYVKLTGLSPGHHTLYFGGVIPGPGGIPTFETSVNYSLTQL